MSILICNNKPDCMIKIFLDSVKKNSYNVKRTDHAANSVARSYPYSIRLF